MILEVSAPGGRATAPQAQFAVCTPRQHTSIPQKAATRHPISVSISLGVQSADLLATLQVVPNERVIRTPSDSLRSIRRDIQTEDLQCVGMLVSVM